MWRSHLERPAQSGGAERHLHLPLPTERERVNQEIRGQLNLNFTHSPPHTLTPSQGQPEKTKTVVVLDQRRANNILIEIKRFPAARHIKTAILSMDHAYFTREMVEKLLTKLMPTDEERTQITEARASQPDVPLGPAEEFLYTLTTIPELKARLSLWRFNFQFQQAEEVWGTGEWGIVSMCVWVYRNWGML